MTNGIAARLLERYKALRHGRRAAGVILTGSAAALLAIGLPRLASRATNSNRHLRQVSATLSTTVASATHDRLEETQPALGRRPDNAVQLCQGVCDCSSCVPWQAGGPGEYVDHPRTAHVPVYRIRVDDVLRCVYRITRNESSRPYQLSVGDEVLVESFSDAALNRTLIIQPDGTITLRLLGQVQAAHLTVPQLSSALEKSYDKFYKEPSITVTPVRVNTKLEDLRATVDARAGTGGQGLEVRVTPDGSISLPAVGPVPVQGLTLDEIERELNLRYAHAVDGIEVTPILEARAPRYVYVLGEVKLPGRYVLEGPTTVMQAITMGGSWNVGANLKQIVVFRRGDDWQLMATMVDLQGALSGKCKCPAGEIWLGDSDVVLIPKSPILRADDFINLVFTRGIYGVMPFTTSYSFSPLTTIP